LIVYSSSGFHKTPLQYYRTLNEALKKLKAQWYDTGAA